jgi:hypothetical protein
MSLLEGLAKLPLDVALKSRTQNDSVSFIFQIASRSSVVTGNTKRETGSKVGPKVGSWSAFWQWERGRFPK